MTQDEFISAIHSRKHTIPQLRRKLEALPAAERMTTLIRIFADSSRPAEAFGDQEYAGRLMTELRPKIQDQLSDIIRDILPTWNVSVEQLPNYLADVFGRDCVTECASSMISDFPADSRERRALETICWWIRGRSAMLPTTNNKGEQADAGNRRSAGA